MKQHQYRHEMKYLISELDYYTIKNRLKHILKPDQNVDHKGQYQIRSLYFDNYNNQALFEKIAGHIELVFLAIIYLHYYVSYRFWLFLFGFLPKFLT